VGGGIASAIEGGKSKAAVDRCLVALESNGVLASIMIPVAIVMVIPVMVPIVVVGPIRIGSIIWPASTKTEVEHWWGDHDRRRRSVDWWRFHVGFGGRLYVDWRGRSHDYGRRDTNAKTHAGLRSCHGAE
jgi:hypothetical protein